MAKGVFQVDMALNAMGGRFKVGLDVFSVALSMASSEEFQHYLEEQLAKRTVWQLRGSGRIGCGMAEHVFFDV